MCGVYNKNTEILPMVNKRDPGYRKEIETQLSMNKQIGMMIRLTINDSSICLPLVHKNYLLNACTVKLHDTQINFWRFMKIDISPLKLGQSYVGTSIKS